MSDIRKPAVFRIAPDAAAPDEDTPDDSRLADQLRARYHRRANWWSCRPLRFPPPKRMRWSLDLDRRPRGAGAIWAGLSIRKLIESLFAALRAFGWIGVALAGVAGLAAFALVVREIWGLMRLNRIEHIQADAAHALNHDDAEAAERT